MYQDILKSSARAMNNDVNIIRITFFTSFFHSLVVILLIIINLHTLFSKKLDSGFAVGRMVEYLVTQVNHYHLVPFLIGIALFLFLLYSLIYPVGQAAIILYLQEKDHNDQPSLWKTLKRGAEYFFPMFKFSAFSLLFSPAAFFVACLKVSVAGGFSHSFMFWIFALWFVLLNIVNSFKSYTRYFLVLQDLSVTDALKKSISLTRENLSDTLKYVRMQTILLILFSVNLLLVVGIPFLIMYLALRFEFMHYRWIKSLLYLSFSVLVLLGAYTSNFIRAFFAYYWYVIFVRHIK